jgi:hypothetical protein
MTVVLLRRFAHPSRDRVARRCRSLQPKSQRFYKPLCLLNVTMRSSPSWTFTTLFRRDGRAGLVGMEGVRDKTDGLVPSLVREWRSLVELFGNPIVLRSDRSN